MIHKVVMRNILTRTAMLITGLLCTGYVFCQAGNKPKENGLYYHIERELSDSTIEVSFLRFLPGNGIRIYYCVLCNDSTADGHFSKKNNERIRFAITHETKLNHKGTYTIYGDTVTVAGYFYDPSRFRPKIEETWVLKIDNADQISFIRVICKRCKDQYTFYEKTDTQNFLPFKQYRFIDFK